MRDVNSTATELSRSFVDNQHERQIKYDRFGGRPSVGGRPGARGPSPLNPALRLTTQKKRNIAKLIPL